MRITFTDTTDGVASAVGAAITGGSLATVGETDETRGTNITLGLVRRTKGVSLVAGADDLSASTLGPVHVIGTVRDDAIDVVGWHDQRLE